jgi:NADH-quinone oxidoreductase subunit G
LDALLVGGVEIADLPDPRAARHALSAAQFLVSLELRRSEVTEHADVVFPVAPVAEKSGTFLNWEGRQRFFAVALQDSATLTDLRVLDAIAAEMGFGLGLANAAAARDELQRLGTWAGTIREAPTTPPASSPRPLRGQAILAGWRMLLDSGRLQDGEPHLAGTARPPVVRLSPSTAAEIGAIEADPVTVSTHLGAITLPLNVSDLPDRVVWLPMNSGACAVHDRLGVTAGALVTIGAPR